MTCFFRKVIIIFFPCLFLAAPVSSQSPLPVPVVHDRLTGGATVQWCGYLATRLMTDYRNRIMAQDVDRLVAPFRDRSEDHCWQTEFWGKWFTSAVLAYRYHPNPDLKNILENAVSGLMATQTPDGYIGNYANDKHLQQWDVWGRKYVMLGLLAWYDLTGEQKSLDAASREADFLIKELHDRNISVVKTGNYRGMASSSVLEPVCLLYTRTGKKAYLDFAKEIVNEWETPEGPQLISKADVDVAGRFPQPQHWYSPQQGQKAYEMMSCYEGLLELYRLTGQEEYLQAVVKTWQNIMETEINIAGSGAAMECWFGGKNLQTQAILHYQETCVTVTWIRLSMQLLRLTGEARYADAIEKAWYNALLGALHTDGADWAKYSPLSGIRLQGEGQCGMGINCCVANGPRALFLMPLTAVMSDRKGLSVNFYAPGSYFLKSPSGSPVTIEQVTDYPVGGNIKILLSPEKAERMTLRIRIPGWSDSSEVAVNGRVVQDIIPGRYLNLDRIWQAGDTVIVKLDMHGRILHLGNLPEYVAFMHGPVVLARDRRINNVPVELPLQQVSEKQGFTNLDPVMPTTAGIWMSFSVPVIIESHKESGNRPVKIMLCDYASAGNTLDKHSWFRVWSPMIINPQHMKR